MQRERASFVEKCERYRRLKKLKESKWSLVSHPRVLYGSEYPSSSSPTTPPLGLKLFLHMYLKPLYPCKYASLLFGGVIIIEKYLNSARPTMFYLT